MSYNKVKAIWPEVIRREDSPQERICKEFFNSHYFKTFKRDYEKFKKYSIIIGSYQTKRYEVENFVFSYVQKNYPNFVN